MSRSGGHTEDFSDVFAAEQDWIERRRQAAGVEAPIEEQLGLALSGGGIRSATFNLGVLQALEAKGVLKRVDYLSSVSGGGYVASCLSWLISRLGPDRSGSMFAAPVVGTGETVLDRLRAHGCYLISGRGFSGWTLGASILAGTLLNLVVLLPVLLLALGIATLEWLPLHWPGWMQPPGASDVHGHDGFLLLFWAGVAAFGLYALTVFGFAAVSGIRLWRSVPAILRIRTVMGRLLATGFAFVAIAMIPVLAMLEDTVARMVRDEDGADIWRQASYLVPMISGILAMFRARPSRRAQSSGRLAALGLALLIYGLLVLGYQLIVHTNLFLSTGFLVWLALSVVLAFVCDVNWVSMHSYYRGRLTGAYLPKVVASDAEDVDALSALRFRLCEITPDAGGPYHLINTTLNTTSSSNQKLRSRQGASFTLSPLYCGAAETGYRATTDYVGGRMELSTAFTISGAAIDPDTQATRARSISALMALLNVRLGYWTVNPSRSGPGLPLPWWYVFIGREVTGTGLSATRDHVHLSDGGQFDNLGIYELLRRGCRYIIVSDAGADPNLTFSDLGKAIERARSDFGAEVDIHVDTLVESDAPDSSRLPFVVGSVRYRDGTRGEILYLKPRMRSGFGADIYAYWRHNQAFPDQATSDQFFDEAQFEAYRELGRQTMDRLLGAAPFDTIQALFERTEMQQVPTEKT